MGQGRKKHPAGWRSDAMAEEKPHGEPSRGSLPDWRGKKAARDPHTMGRGVENRDFGRVGGLTRDGTPSRRDAAQCSRRLCAFRRCGGGARAAGFPPRGRDSTGQNERTAKSTILEVRPRVPWCVGLGLLSRQAEREECPARAPHGA